MGRAVLCDNHIDKTSSSAITPIPGSPRNPATSTVTALMEVCPRERRHGIEQPQAQKATPGVYADFENQFHGHQQQPHQHQRDQGGNEQRNKFFHRHLRIIRLVPVKLPADSKETGTKRDDGCFRPFHLLSSVSPNAQRYDAN